MTRLIGSVHLSAGGSIPVSAVVQGFRASRVKLGVDGLI